MTKQGRPLLEVDVQPPIGHPIDALVVLVGPQGRVQRRQDRVFARLADRGSQRIALQATAAIHVAGAAGQVKDSHLPSGSCSRSQSTTETEATTKTENRRNHEKHELHENDLIDLLSGVFVYFVSFVVLSPLFSLPII